jgi:hypothetical protein
MDLVNQYGEHVRQRSRKAAGIRESRCLPLTDSYKTRQELYPLEAPE